MKYLTEYCFFHFQMIGGRNLIRFYKVHLHLFYFHLEQEKS